MQSKKLRIIKVLISICISVILIFICFYKYNEKVKQIYLNESNEVAFENGYIYVKMLQNHTDEIVSSLKSIEEYYLKDVNQINDFQKFKFYTRFKELGGNVKIYSIEEIEEHLLKNKDYITSDNYAYDNITLLYKPLKDQNDKTSLEFIYIISKNNIKNGAVSISFSKSEFFRSFLDFQKMNNFFTFILDKYGNVVYGKDVYLNENAFEFLLEYQSNKNIDMSKIESSLENGVPINIKFNISENEYISFLTPFSKTFSILQVISANELTRISDKINKYMFIILAQVIIVITAQVLYLFSVITRQIRNFEVIENKKRNELNSFINSVPGGVVRILFNNQLKIIFANDSFYDILGYDKTEYTELFQSSHAKVIYPKDIENMKQTIKELVKDKKPLNIEYRVIKSNKEIAWISLTGTYLESIEDIPVYQCILMDLTNYKKILNDLKIEKEQYGIVSKISDEVIFEYDVIKDYIKISEKYRETFDLDIVNQSFLKNLIKNIHKDDLKGFLKNLVSIKRSEDTFGYEVRIKNNSGNYNWAFYQGVVIRNEYGNVNKIVGKATNIDKFKKEIEHLKEKANKDPLTQVYNKTAIENILNESIDTKGESKHAIFVIDIDNFKKVNDTFGHIFGDFVLKEITSNILKVFSNGEIIARIGGDEFLVFLENIEDFEVINQKAKMLCDIFRKTYVNQNKDYEISASIGISLYPNHATEYENLIENADIAVYYAKNEGKDRYKIYNKDMKYTDINKAHKEDKPILSSKNLYESILINASEVFLEVKDIETTINLILDNISKSLKVNRCYVFEVSDDLKHISNTYEWCDDGVIPLIDLYQDLDFDFQEYLSIYDENSFLYYDNINTINYKEMPINNYIIGKESIKSLFSCHFVQQGDIKGFIGFEKYDGMYDWDNKEIESALVLSRLIGSQILKGRAEQKFDTENQINKAIVNNQQLYTYIIKKDTFEVVYYNEEVKDIMPHIELGKVCYSGRGYNSSCSHCLIKNFLDDSESNTSKYYCEITDKWFGVTSTKIKWLDKSDAYVVCYKDVSEYIEQINYLDSLTGISNLNKFKIKAESLLKNMYYTNYAILYLDINKFKYINDNFGYSKGDEVLRVVAKSLHRECDKNETFCRINDDRFLALVKYEDQNHLDTKVKMIYNSIENLLKENLENIKLVVLSGIYKISEKDIDLTTAIDKANLARKSIKTFHKSNYLIYTDEMNDKLKKEKNIESKMFKAIENGEFMTYLQPKVDLSTNKVCGAEALIRWENEDKIIYPDEFIPIFEKNGFIVNSDFFIYEEILRKTRKWIDSGIKPLDISLNVSRINLSNIDFPDKIFSLIKKYMIPVSLVELEITESIFSEDVENLKYILKRLRRLGFKLSIDDFGSAYSSLNLLKEIDVDIIKLDKGFLHHNGEFKTKDKVIIEYIVKMAKELGIKVVCEGIENEQQLEFLKEIGCEIGQGYLFSKPLSIEDFEKEYL